MLLDFQPTDRSGSIKIARFFLTSPLRRSVHSCSRTTSSPRPKPLQSIDDLPQHPFLKFRVKRPLESPGIVRSCSLLAGIELLLLFVCSSTFFPLFHFHISTPGTGSDIFVNLQPTSRSRPQDIVRPPFIRHVHACGSSYARPTLNFVHRTTSVSAQLPLMSLPQISRGAAEGITPNRPSSLAIGWESISCFQVRSLFYFCSFQRRAITLTMWQIFSSPFVLVFLHSPDLSPPLLSDHSRACSTPNTIRKPLVTPIEPPALVVLQVSLIGQ